MNGQFWANLLKAGTAGVQLAQQSSGSSGRRKKKSGSKKAAAAEDCTPCAAEAYVEALRPKS